MRTSRTFSEYGTIQTFRIVRTRNTSHFERQSIRIFDSRNAQLHVLDRSQHKRPTMAAVLLVLLIVAQSALG